MRLFLKSEFRPLKKSVCNKKHYLLVLLVSSLKRTIMKTQVNTLDKSDLNTKRNHVLALYIVTITFFVTAYTAITAVQYL